MMKAVIILFHLIFLIAHANGNIHQCSNCEIPCVPDQTTTTSFLLQTFHHSVRGYTLVTFLDAINGDVRFMCSNGTDVFTKTMSVVGFTMSELCSIFNLTPRLLRTNPSPKVKFRYLSAHTLSEIVEYENFYLFERMSLLLNEQRDINIQLSDAKSSFNTLNDTIHDRVQTLQSETSLNLEVVKLQNDTIHDIQTLQSETSLNLEVVKLQNAKVEMRKKLEYATMRATISGIGMYCHPDRSFLLQFPGLSRKSQHCAITYPNWMHLDLKQEYEINVIQLYFFDGDPRTTTYSIDISEDKQSWTSIITRNRGEDLVTLEFGQTYKLRYLRMNGINTVNEHFAIYWMKLDLI